MKPAQCLQIERVYDYVNATLPAPDYKEVSAHIAACSDCASAVKSLAQVQGILKQALNPAELGREFHERMEARLTAIATPPITLETVSAQPSLVATLSDRLSGAPWWGVSVVLHVLVIALAGLISMAVHMPQPQEALITVTELAARSEVKTEPQSRNSERNILAAKKETPPTDPTSKEACEVVVPPELLARAELGDHFETINPDRADTRGAFGNPEAHMFHSEKGSDEAEGGGGTNGLRLDDLIGASGTGSPGTGGGWGGGNGTGIGLGNGSGRGSFGNRTAGGRKLMIKKHRGAPATENAVDAALEWLARNQEADGSWNTAKHGAAAPGPDVGATALALLAFLGAGHTENIGKYKDTVKRAQEWLISKQQANGVIGNGFWGNGYCHAIAGLALAEATAMTPKNTKLKEAAQKAIDYSCNVHQCGAGTSERSGWRYTPGSPPDTSVTGWYIMQLKAAKIAGLKVDTLSLEGAERWLNHVEVEKATRDDPYKGGTFGYTSNQGTYASITSVGMLGRIFLGHNPETLRGGVKLLSKNLPNWDNPGAGAHDHPLYYWYYGTLAMFQVGGEDWKTWNEAMKKTLLDHQCKGGNNDGSWNPLAQDGQVGGRVVCTALAILTLEVYYRYQKLN